MKGTIRHTSIPFLYYNVVGYRRGSYNTSSDWDLMWAHDYPFKKIKDKMLAMKKGQRINKFPGSGFITNKVNYIWVLFEPVLVLSPFLVTQGRVRSRSFFNY